ncbi:hypothetical protein HK102_002580, partial [Quaeritorhiza haematococci]
MAFSEGRWTKRPMWGTLTIFIIITVLILGSFSLVWNSQVLHTTPHIPATAEELSSFLSIFTSTKQQTQNALTNVHHVHNRLVGMEDDLDRMWEQLVSSRLLPNAEVAKAERQAHEATHRMLEALRYSRKVQYVLQKNLKKIAALESQLEKVPKFVWESRRKECEEASYKIPKIMHQSWKTSTVPPRFSKWSSSWKRLHPTWEYRLWTDDDNRALVESHYPWFLETYNSFPKNILRADTARYMYMHRYGGVYADLDMEVVKPMEELFRRYGDPSSPPPTQFPWWARPQLLGENGGLYLGFMSMDFDFVDNIPNAWMASRPGHSFWLHLLRLIQIKSRSGIVRTEDITGPVVVQEAMKKYIAEVPLADRDGVTLLEPGIIYPFDWHDREAPIAICAATEPTLDESACKQYYHATGKPEDRAFTITYWSHTWEGPENLQVMSDQQPLPQSPPPAAHAPAPAPASAPPPAQPPAQAAAPPPQIVVPQVEPEADVAAAAAVAHQRQQQKQEQQSSLAPHQEQPPHMEFLPKSNHDPETVTAGAAGFGVG